MSLIKRGAIYHYDFWKDGRRHQGSTGQTRKDLAINVERDEKARLARGYREVLEREEQARGRRTVAEAAGEYLKEYEARHRAPVFAKNRLKHVTRLLGESLVNEITPARVNKYQSARLAEKAGPKTINEEVKLLLRILGDQGELVRGALRRLKALALAVPPSPGKAFSAAEKARMIEAARSRRSTCQNIYPALVLALNTGLRSTELRTLTWGQVDLIRQRLTVGQSKTEAGTGRVVPLNELALEALKDHAAWFSARFGSCEAPWHVFAWGRPRPSDPTRPASPFKRTWDAVRTEAGVQGRFHDTRHTVVTELAEGGASDEAIMSIAGHVDRKMLARYSHIREQARRDALEALATRQRKAEAEIRKQREEQERRGRVEEPSAARPS